MAVEDSSFIEVLFRTLINGPAEHALDDLEEMRKGFEALMVMASARTQGRELEPDKTALYDGYVKKLVNWSRGFGRAFVLTEGGRLGQVSGGVEVGDKIALVAGSHIPFVLRENEGSEEGERLYRLIGEGYVHGLTPPASFGAFRGQEEYLILV